jgi:photosystem II stability/assembly factor-like uncharacterized protein
MQVIQLSLFLTAVLGVAAAQSSASAQPQSPSPAQQVWQMQESGTTAGLRGIDSVDGTVAWASGTCGTVLRTTDGGAHWQRCAVPDAATDGGTLDFRGVQAWDCDTAIVMASGPGDKSRLYKTTDGCKTWTLLFGNEGKDGFWDALRMWTPTDGFLAGDPVDGKLFLAEAVKELGQFVNGGFVDNYGYLLKARGKGEAAFAASNSCIALGPFDKQDGASRDVWFATGGTSGVRVIHLQHFDGGEPERLALSVAELPMFPRSQSGGAFSLGFRDTHKPFTEVFFRGGGGTNLTNWQLIAVGGDYSKPIGSTGTAAWSEDSGRHWTASTIPPHGFRSAVQWSEALNAWITAGTNGSDISRDDGKTWKPLDDGNWNALSLPFVVGPSGRIARLNPQSLGSTPVQP